MKIKLPSNFGLRVVEMRKPTMGDLRESYYENPNPQYRKLRFVKSLLAPGTDTSGITLWDAEYLFAIAAFVVQYNQIVYNVTCPYCTKKFQHVLSLGSQEVVAAKQDLARTVSFPFDKQTFSLRTLTMRILGLCATAYFQHQTIVRERFKNERLTQNLRTMTDVAKEQFVRDSLRSLEEEAMVLDIQELRDLRAKDAMLIRDLRLRLKDVRNICTAAAEYRDTVVLVAEDGAENGGVNGGVAGPAPVLAHKDSWADICYNPADSTLSYTFRDSVSAILHVAYQKRFLWWRWKPRYAVTAVSHNPRCSRLETQTVVLIDE